MSIEIWHNPRCSKSRKALELLTERGAEPRIVEYLSEPPSAERLAEVLERLGLEPRELMRTGEAVYRELDLASVTDRDALIRAMVENPILIERPVVIAGERALVGRPPERVLELL